MRGDKTNPRPKAIYTHPCIVLSVWGARFTDTPSSFLAANRESETAQSPNTRGRHQQGGTTSPCYYLPVLLLLARILQASVTIGGPKNCAAKARIVPSDGGGQGRGSITLMPTRFPIRLSFSDQHVVQICRHLLQP